jgi:chaperonin cofactor prefoldin
LPEKHQLTTDIQLGQTVYDLEEACEELKLRETNLTAELKAADEDFEKLESALKDDRRKWKHEKDALLADFTSSEQRLEKEIAALNRKTAEKDQVSAMSESSSE